VSWSGVVIPFIVFGDAAGRLKLSKSSAHNVLKRGEPCSGALALPGTGILRSKRSRTVKTMPPLYPLCASADRHVSQCRNVHMMSDTWGKELMI